MLQIVTDPGLEHISTDRYWNNRCPLHFKNYDKDEQVLKNFGECSEDLQIKFLKYLFQNNEISTIKYIMEKFNVDISVDDNVLFKTAVCCNILSIHDDLNIDFDETTLGYLLKNGVHPSTANNFALKCLSGVYKTDTAILKLLEYGADVHAEDDYMLRNSAFQMNYSLMKLLLEKGANVHARNDYVLNKCLQRGKLEHLKLLFDHDVNISSVSNEMVINAIKSQSIDVVKFLMERGFDLKALNNHQSSVNQKAFEMFNFLTSNGVGVEKSFSLLMPEKTFY